MAEGDRVLHDYFFKCTAELTQEDQPFFITHALAKVEPISVISLRLSTKWEGSVQDEWFTTHQTLVIDFGFVDQLTKPTVFYLYGKALQIES